MVSFVTTRAEIAASYFQNDPDTLQHIELFEMFLLQGKKIASNEDQTVDRTIGKQEDETTKANRYFWWQMIDGEYGDYGLTEEVEKKFSESGGFENMQKNARARRLSVAQLATVYSYTVSSVPVGEQFARLPLTKLLDLIKFPTKLDQSFWTFSYILALSIYRLSVTEPDFRSVSHSNYTESEWEVYRQEAKDNFDNHKVYRGIKVPVSQFEKMRTTHDEGRHIIWYAFSSASLCADVAHTFLFPKLVPKEPTVPVLFVITHKTGKVIFDMSQYLS